MNTRYSSQAADEEAALIRRIASGDESALEELYDRYSRLLYSIMLSALKSQEEAQDALQELFLHVWRQAKNFNAERGSAYSWLVTMTRNRAIDRLRSKGYRDKMRESPVDEAMTLIPDMAYSPLDCVTILELRQAVQEALAKIPAEQRDALILAYYQGHTQAEISELLQLPLGTVKTRMRQGLLKLSTLLQGKI